MKLFRNKKTAKSNNAGDKAAGWIASGISRIQNSWAKAMDRCFNRRSLKTRKALLLAALLFIVAYSSLLLAFSFKSPGLARIKPVAIMQPMGIGKTATLLPTGMPAFIRRIENFKRYLDSLDHTESGKRIRDSLLLRRPGLLDSIQQIETIYCNK